MKVALIEISESHEECLYSQLRFLQAGGHTTDLYLHPNHRAGIDAYRNLAASVTWITPGRGLAGAFRLSRRLARYDRVLFNTASSSKFVRNLCVFLLACDVPCFGILHDTRRLDSSFTQRLISRKIKDYFVLSDALANTGAKSAQVRLCGFYPVYFPEYRHSVPRAPGGTIRICIPGRISSARRDYAELFQSLSGPDTPENLEFILLGRLDPHSETGSEILGHIRNLGVQHRIRTFDRFLDNGEFHAWVKSSDYLMPLIPRDGKYLVHKISGGMNLAYAYRKTLLCSAEFRGYPDFEENAVWYQPEALASFWQVLATAVPQPDNAYADPKWDFGFQAQKYLGFLRSDPPK